MSKGIKSIFGGSSPQATTVTPNTPAFVSQFQQDIFNRANTVANQLGVRQFAGFSPLQRQGFNFLSGINRNPGIQAAQGALAGMAGMQFGSQQITPDMVGGFGYDSTNAGLANLGDATTAQGMGYSPTAAGLGGLGNATGFDVSQAGAGTLGDASTFAASTANAGTLGNAAMMNAASMNRGDIRNVAAQNFLQGNIGAYQNPYTSQVIDASMRDIDRARQLQQQQVNAQAAARGAYGGSRQAVAESENSRNYLDQQARTIAGLRQQGFDTAANLMTSDMNRKLQADMSNQGMDFNVGQQNAGFRQQANAANQQAANQFALSRYAQEGDISRFNAANAQQAAAANAAAQNQFALQRYGTEADLSRFNAANQTAANQFLAGAMNDFGLQRFGAENALNQFNASNANAASQFGAGAANAASLANQQAANQFALSDFNAANNMSQFNAANANNAAQFGADAANRASLANQSAGLTAQTQNANNQLQAQQLMASNLGNLFTGGVGLNNSFLGNVNAQLQAGALQQQLAQQRMDAIRNLPMEQLGILSSTFNSTQLPTGQTQVSPGVKPNYVGTIGGLGIAAAAAGLL